MNQMPASVRPSLRRLARRLAIGLFLDRWPVWAVGSLLVAGVAVVICRLFVPAAGPYLPWFWLAPVLAAIPVLVTSMLRRYRPGEVVAVADWLGGGDGTLLTLFETGDADLAASPLAAQASQFALPRLRPWRKLAMLIPAAAFLLTALWLPQRTPASGIQPALADEIAAELTSTLAALQEEKLITPAEEERLEKEIERIRESTKERVSPSTWESADALREQIAAGLAEKQDAVKWAEASLSRYAAAAQAGDSAAAGAHAAELSSALEKLAASGLLAGLSPELQQLLKAGKLGAPGEAFGKLTASLAEQLAAANGRLANAAGVARGFGRFDPAEFATGRSEDGNGQPGRGGVNRGRADAQLTYGKESQPLDRFKATPLPPGAARSADDWAPIVVLPGAPQEAAKLSTASTARQYESAAGQAAWRRSLAPRHQSAVRKYFDK